MRRLVLLTVVAFAAITAIAYAVNDTITYKASGSHKGKPSARKPVNFTYTGTLHIDTSPPGQQPDVSPRTDVYFDKGLKRNGALFPFCNQSEVDGTDTIPAKCKKAIVGGGSATAKVGKAGNPPSITETMPATLMNGPRGKKLFLIIHSTPGQPINIKNRVIPGTYVKSSGNFGFLVRFDVPTDLQHNSGFDVSLTDFKVTVSGKPRTFRVKGKRVVVSYLQLTACPKGKQHSRAVTYFTDNQTQKQKTVRSNGTGKC